MDFTIRPCTPSDLAALHALAYETFDQAFRARNDPADFAAYMQTAFTPEKLRAELTNPHSFFYFLAAGDEPIGYLKLNLAPAQSDLNDPASLEVERIYVRQGYQGQGLGARLLAFTEQIAAAHGKRRMWLGVWENNRAAIAFYQKMGFVETGRHTFMMGADPQTDLIMTKDLPLLLSA